MLFCCTIPGSHHLRTLLPPPRDLTVLRMVYFFFFSAVGVFFPFINIYFLNIGLSGSQIGFINTLSPLLAMATGPLFGYLSDRFGITRLLMMIAAGGAIVAALGMSAVLSYPLLLVFAAVLALFFTPLIPMIDSIQLKVLGERRELYGRQRFWGSVGFIFTAFVLGYILNLIGLNYLFHGFAIFMLATLIVFIWLPDTRVESSSFPRAGFLSLLGNKEWQLFAVSLLLLGVANSGLNIFLSIYIQELGGAETLIGTAWALGAVFELPVMFFSTIIFRFLNARKMLLLAFFFYSIRFFLYSILPSPEYVLLLSLMHGITYGFYLIGGVSYANELAPEGMKSTGQGLLLSIFQLATITGSVAGGYLYDSFGTLTLFQVYSGLALAALVLQIIGRRMLLRSQAILVK